MANKTQRHGDNVPGPYYVDRDCVLCHVCAELAPDHFHMSDDGDHMIVVKQPTTPEEHSLCAQAMEGCPMDAVGDDGE